MDRSLLSKSSKLKLRPSIWVPKECLSLLKYCSGYYNHPEITWDLNKNTQILLLASKLRAPDNFELSTWEKLINNLKKNIRFFIEKDPTISPGTVKVMVNFICSLFKEVNYEISFIEAKLSNIAERTISNLVFAYAFQSLWNTNKSLENKVNLETKRNELFQYFLQKVETRKMVRGTWDHNRMKESDNKMANTFAVYFTRAVERGVETLEQPTIDKLFNEIQESMSHETIFFTANSMLNQVLNHQPSKEVISEFHFVVHYICNRNALLMTMFQDIWNAKVENVLYHEIAKNMKIRAMKQIRIVTNVLRQLLEAIEANAARLRRKERNAFDSDSNFELSDMKSFKSSGTDSLVAKESPFKSVTLFFRMYLDPLVSPEEFNHFFANTFAINGVLMKRSDTYILCDKPVDPPYALDTELFKRLEKTLIFNSESIYNIFEYLTVFI